VRHQALSLVESSLSGEPIVWRLGGLSEDQLRELVVAAVGLAAVFARASAARGKLKPAEVVAWVRSRI
jgi:hypothetical protein